MDNSEFGQYYDFGEGEFATAAVYDTESPVSGTASDSSPGNPWPGYPSGYSMTHIAVSAVVVTAIMMVIILGNVDLLFITSRETCSAVS